ncbi:hypothetical protein ACFYT3_31535 [Nocardia amikacinitolerans]
MTLVNGCELSMRRWVNTGEYRTQAELDRIAQKALAAKIARRWRL